MNQWISVTWQDGPRKEAVTSNGAQVEDVINVAIERLEFLDSQLESHWNKMALESLRGALGFLEERTKERIERGVEGTNQK